MLLRKTIPAALMALVISLLFVSYPAMAATASSSMGGSWPNQNPARMVDGDLNAFYKTNRAPLAGDWVQVDLGSNKEVSQIGLYMTSANNPNDRIQQGVIEVSSNGSNWSTLGSFAGQNEVHVTAPGGTMARYVRARATSNNDFYWLVVREFAVDQAIASSSMGVDGSNGPSRMTDGNTTTFYKSDRGVQAGDWVQVDLGGNLPVAQIGLLMTEPNSPNDKIEQGVLEVSSDGSNWTSLASFSNQDEWHVTPPVNTTARFVRARATAANTDYCGGWCGPWWLVVREFEVTLGQASPGNESPQASFTSSCTDLACDFADTSIDSDGTIVAWSWDFGDGSTSTAQNPSHTYSTAGTFTVTLTVMDNDDATGTASGQVSVSAPGGNQPPVASFDSSCTGLSCDYTDTSTDPDGTVVGWLWDFGDGNTSTTQNPSHTYAASGTYTVSLEVTDNDGAAGSASNNVAVTDEPPPSGSVEDHFAATGPWTVSTGSASAPGTPGVSLWYPTDLGASGYQHPVITWGNGTGATCQATNDNGGIFSLLASWGNVIVCANSSNTGTGAEILAAAEWMVDQDDNASSVFFGKLNTAKVGAAGGSQGASGAVNAMLQSNGLITSAVGVALTDPWVHNFWQGDVPDFSQVQDPLFLISGTEDDLTSQPQQQSYYDQIPGPAAKAALAGVGHDTAGLELGYLTAWFKYTLEGDQFAREAFVGNPPQLNADPDWTNQAEKNLP